MAPGADGGDGGIEFADEAIGAGGAPPAWKILIADDEHAVHEVIRLALANTTVAGRALEFRDAYDGVQACVQVRDDADIALVLMDISMERERAGLEAARAIRGPIGNRRVRIVLSSGDLEPALRPGTMQQLDLSECWLKTDLTARRLSAIVTAALEQYTESPAPTRGAARPDTQTLRALPPERLN